MPDLSGLSVLYVEDEPELREHVAYALRLYCGQVDTASNGEEALALTRRRRPDLVVSDIRMPQLDGLGLTNALKTEFPDLPVILCTAFSDTEYLLRAIELGVAGYITKPIDTAKLMERVRQATLPLMQQRELARLKAESNQARALLFGDSPVMRELADQVAEVAAGDFSVTLLGEAGSGKSVVAWLLHGMSGRHDRSLLTIDCRGRNSDQLEAELFGPPPGRGRPPEQPATGMLAAFHGGVVVLDAPNCLPLALQMRLHRQLEERSYLPTGAATRVPCDLRPVAIFPEDPRRLLDTGQLSPELWLCLSDLVLTVPPLRARSGEVARLSRLFLEQAADELGRPCPELTPEATALLVGAPWPGNLRQLKQVMRRALFLAGNPITAPGIAPLIAPRQSAGAAPSSQPASLKLVELEEWAVRQALEVTGGKKMQAAELLGISYNSFKEKLKRCAT